MLLFIITGQHLPEIAFNDSNLSDYLVCRCRPLEGLRVLVPRADVLLNCPREMWDGDERAAADRLAGKDSEPDLDLVHPRATNGRVMERDVRVPFKPSADVNIQPMYVR